MNPKFVRLIQNGLPLVSQPWKKIADSNLLSEDELLNTTRTFIEMGLIKRFGLVVKHRSLGYKANAMVVWDIPEDQIEEIGKKMAAYEFVRLCYQRPRRLPDWPFNLFCMIHGKDREYTLERLQFMKDKENLNQFDHQILFSRRCFKQNGARYS